MSIVTLKRKTASTYKAMSSGEKQFSLNGTLRSQGYVGQTSLSRSLPKTPMKGNVACGHGGCCGTYNNGPIIQSAVISLNDATVVKSSVLNTSGMLDTKYRWITRPDPFAVVKPDSNNHFRGSDYVNYLKQKTIDKINDCKYVGLSKVLIAKNTMNPNCINNINSNKTCKNSTLFRSDLFPNKTITMNQTVKPYNTMSHGYTDDYYSSLDSKCYNAGDLNKPSNIKKDPIVNR